MARLARAEIDLDRLKTLVEFFPIGKSLSYFPEFKKEVVFETFVLAYCANGNFVYSGDAIERDARGRPAVFHAGTGERRTTVSALYEFQLLVPDTSDLEMKLDYHRRAPIGRGRQFTKGHYISLISNVGSRGVATVDAEVAKQVVMREGPYEQSHMVLLTPDLHTLAVSDQRGKGRIEVCVPVVVSAAAGKLSGPGTIVDMSDNAMRIRLRDRDTAALDLRVGDELLLDVELAEKERSYRLKATVLRHAPAICVVRLDGLFKEGKVSRVCPPDLLELKAGLLNYGR